MIREGRCIYRQHRELRNRANFDRLLDELAQCEEEEELNRWMIEGIRSRREELFELHSQEPSFPRLAEQIYMYPRPVACWGNKILRVEVCPDLLQEWPDAQVVILNRDPRAVCSSMLKKFKNTTLRYAAMYWNLHARWARLNATDAIRYLVVKYEDFVLDPSRELERILRHVDLWDAQTAARMLAEHPVSTASLAKWRRSLPADSIRAMESYCFDEMQHLGYKPELADRGRRIGPLTGWIEMSRIHMGDIRLNIGWLRRKRILTRLLRNLRALGG
jgi:hypothetical protein